MKIERLFPVPIYTANLNREIYPEEYKFADEQLTHFHIRETKSLITDNNYVLKDESLSGINKFINFHLKKFSHEILKIHPKTLIQITQSWFSSMDKNTYVHIHNHANSFISGVFYFNAKRNIDSIDFYNPFKYEQISPNYTEYNQDNSMMWSLPVHTGKLIMFKSHLEHRVPIKKTNNKRISLAFNTFLENKSLTSAKIINQYSVNY